MKKIPLTKGKFAIVDDCDYDSVSMHKWFFDGQGYAARSRNTKMVRGERKVWREFMHRFILNTPEGFFTDHINGNKLDNRRENLRICNKSQNSANTKKRSLKNPTSIYKGVSKVKGSYSRWKARIMVNYKEVNLGRYGSEEEAARAYDNAVSKYFGEYGVKNFEEG